MCADIGPVPDNGCLGDSGYINVELNEPPMSGITVEEDSAKVTVIDDEGMANCI